MTWIAAENRVSICVFPLFTDADAGASVRDMTGVTRIRRALRYAAVLFAVVPLLGGCASSAVSEDQREFAQARIAEILSQPLDTAEYGETERCLRDTEFRTFRALDDRHILFEGRRDRYWVNTLPHRCADIRFGDILIVRRFSGTRMCAMDQFSVADWFDWPWYRRWPWRWWSPWHTGMTCLLGEFQPVTEQQVEEIKAVLRNR